MKAELTFGDWLKRRRGGLGLTQKELAQQVGYAEVTLRKVEADELRPSRQMAERLAEVLQIAPEERTQFVRFARDEQGWDEVELPTQLPSVTLLSLSTPPLHNLPGRLTPLLGRERELAEIDLLMFNRNERLITITGPGGIGKTTLALTSAERNLDAGRFRNGVFMISLAAIGTITAILPTLMTALSLPAETTAVSESALKRQLLDYLRARQLLLVFDSFEQLLPGGPLLVEILIAAPRVHILVTARERLHLHDEQVYSIGGLECPASVADDRAPALTLFLRSAQRLQPYFQPSNDDLLHLIRICQLVSGMPLALELAAGWMNVLTPAMIADAILTNLDILQTTLHDVPERHRSIRAVLDGTWTLLSEDERRTFAQLSVFRGGFTRVAAQQIVGATVNQLHTLVEKSLLEYSRVTDRFEIHELLRQYAEEKLNEAGQLVDTQKHHCDYYARFMQARLTSLINAQQTATLAEIEQEINNLRAAWGYAIVHHCFADIRVLAQGLWFFYELSNLFQEAVTTFRHASETLRAVSSTESQTAFGMVLASVGYFSFRQGNLALSLQLMQESVMILRPTGDHMTLLFPLVWLGVVETVMGSYHNAEAWFREFIDVQAKEVVNWGSWLVETARGIGAHDRGEYLNAKQHFSKSLAYCRKSGDLRATTNCLSFFSRTCLALGEYTEAKTLLQESLAISQACNDPFGIATALNHLGLITMQQLDHGQGQMMLLEAASLFEALGDRWSQTRTFNDLADAQLAADNLTTARKYYHEALQIALDAHVPPYALAAVLGLAKLAARQAQPLKALTQLILVEGHAQSTSETKVQAIQLRQELEGQLSPLQVEEARIRAQQLTLELVAIEI